MNSKFNKVNMQIEKKPKKVLFFISVLASFSLLFILASLYKIYDSAYTTYLYCDGYNCHIFKKDIIGEETELYGFNTYLLANVELESQKSVLGEDHYNLVIKNSETEEKYLITKTTQTADEQQEYINLIRDFRRGYTGNTLYLENAMQENILVIFGGAISLCMILLFFFGEAIIKLNKLHREKYCKEYKLPGDI